MATFTSNTSHRAVFSNVGFSRGVHEFRVTILRRPCCGYVGLCASTKLGTQDSFFDSKSCFGINNFSGSGRDVGREAGTSFCIRVDMNRAVSKNGPRLCTRWARGRANRSQSLSRTSEEEYQSVANDMVAEVVKLSKP